MNRKILEENFEAAECDLVERIFTPMNLKVVSMTTVKLFVNDYANHLLNVFRLTDDENEHANDCAGIEGPVKMKLSAEFDVFPWEDVKKYLVFKGWEKDDLGEEIETWTFDGDKSSIQIIARPNDIGLFISEFSKWTRGNEFEIYNEIKEFLTLECELRHDGGL